MSDELNLPDELRAIEARLATKAPPATTLDRDAVLYRAGWAAGVEAMRRGRLRASLATVETGPSIRRRTAVPWSAASAALAAGIAVALMLPWPVSDPQAELASVETAASPVAAERPLVTGTEIKPNVHNKPSMADNLIADIVGGKTGAAATPLLSLRLSPGRLGATNAPTMAAGGVGVAPPKTARQLLDELLPAASPPQDQPNLFRAWPWGGASSGETT
jgi:hypothetical protein